MVTVASQVRVITGDVVQNTLTVLTTAVAWLQIASAAVYVTV